MSRFLAPIHGWLFDKIKVTESLEKDLINSYKDVFGEEVDKIVDSINEECGKPLGDGLLEDLVDSDNIHGWLQNKIAMAETRQAKLLAEAIKKFGEKAEEIAFTAFNNQASILAEKAKNIYECGEAPKIYEAINPKYTHVVKKEGDIFIHQIIRK